MTTPKTAAFILIGNELLSGRTHDKNLAVLAERLTAAGIDLMHACVIPDVETTIIKTVNNLRGQYDYIFTSGGIGPTHDDITSLSIAKAFNVALERNADALAMLESHYEPKDLNAARLKMADIPAGASLIENPVSKAPGFIIENVYVMAGVPRIFAAMLDFVIPKLDGGVVMLSTTISCLKTEGEVAEKLSAIQQQFADVMIGSYPYFKNGSFGVSLVLRCRDQHRLNICEQAVKEII